MYLLQLEEVKPYYMYHELVIRTSRVRNIVRNISLCVPEHSYRVKMGKTLGLIVYIINGGIYILSNAHVITMNSMAEFLLL